MDQQTAQGFYEQGLITLANLMQTDAQLSRSGLRAEQEALRSHTRMLVDLGLAAGHTADCVESTIAQATRGTVQLSLPFGK